MSKSLELKTNAEGKAVIMPENHRQLRACLGCRLILTATQWKKIGKKCPNGCEKEVTTNFTGLACLLDPSKSWVARWQQSQYTVDSETKEQMEYVRGVYALRVHGCKKDAVLEEEEEDYDENVYEDDDGFVDNNEPMDGEEDYDEDM
mmetsp:Transcript_7500/g.18233  ORF Transcript_7500/g.18233 Transcript_7500/m.18233 type:complete len:147 (-) Transcript_7500:258-698(-)